MTSTDLPHVVPLARQLGYPCRIDELAPRFGPMSADDSTALFVAEHPDGAIIGFMQIHETSSLMSDRRAELNAIVIDQSFRGQGLGRQMLRVAEDWARSRDLPKLRLGSRTTRTDAHAFYKQYGFIIEKEWFIFSKSVTGEQ